MKKFVLSHATAKSRAIAAIHEAPQGWEVTIKSPIRSLAANAALHAWISEISKTLLLGGQHHDAEVWKRALVAAWSRTQGETVLEIPAIDGQGIDLVPRRTSQLTKSEFQNLLEYVIAFASENEVVIKDFMGN